MIEHTTTQVRPLKPILKGIVPNYGYYLEHLELIDQFWITSFKFQEPFC
jgi:hypothetical protein